MRPIHKVKHKKDSKEMSSSLIGIKCPSLPASIQNLSQSVENFSKFNVASPKKKILLQNNLSKMEAQKGIF